MATRERWDTINLLFSFLMNIYLFLYKFSVDQITWKNEDASV
jgi:hypothetical protein